MAAGTPEEVAAVEGSYTGRFLRRHRRAPRAGPAGAAAPEGRGGRVNDPDATADWLLSTHGRLARILVGTHAHPHRPRRARGGIIGILLLILGAIPIASAAYGDAADRPAARPRHERAAAGGSAEGGQEGGLLDEDEDEDEERRRLARGRSGLERAAARPRGAPEGQGPRTRDLRADE